MAKEDFCFTYYDGDAAKDVAHMNRLERGCYLDLIHALRKRGHLSESDVKKVLGRDFQDCWEAIEWVMKKDAAGKFFIEWLEKSLEKSRAHSTKQKENVTKRYQPSTKPLPKNDLVTPLEDGDGYRDGVKDELEDKDFGKSENLLGDSVILEMWDVWKKTFPKYTADRKKDFAPLGEILTFICEQAGENFSAKTDQIKVLNTFQLIADQVNRENFWRNKPIKAIASNIQEFYNNIKNPISEKNGRQHGKNVAKLDADKIKDNIAKRYGVGRQASG